jgi:integrase
MAERIRIDHGSLESGKRLLGQWQIPQSVKRELLGFLDDLALGKVNRGRKLSPQRQLKYLYALRTPLEFFHKPTARLVLRDIEEFEKAISAGRLKTRQTRRPFAHGTQVDMRMLLKIFLRWGLGTAKASYLTDWLDTRCRPKTPDFLSEAEIEKLYKHCRTAQQRFLIAVLFDSGARAEEFHNIRYEDIYLPEGKENFVRIALKQEYSKTLGRTVALYWKYSLEAVREYLAERVAKGIKPADPVFQGNYSATRKLLQRMGKRVLRRPVHYHLFRHSSATFNAAKLNRQELCYRYGWRFSSSMPDVYISRAGMETKALDDKFTQTELSAVKADLDQLELTTKIKDERIKQLEKAMQTMQQILDKIARVLSVNPPVAEAEAALRRRRPRR